MSYNRVRLPYTSDCAHVPTLGTLRKKSSEFLLRISPIARFSGLFSGIPRSVPVSPFLVHADSLDEVLRRDYSKYFSLLGSICTLQCLFLCILLKEIHFRFRFDFSQA